MTSLFCETIILVKIFCPKQFLLKNDKNVKNVNNVKNVKVFLPKKVWSWPHMCPRGVWPSRGASTWWFDLIQSILFYLNNNFWLWSYWWASSWWFDLISSILNIFDLILTILDCGPTDELLHGSSIVQGVFLTGPPPEKLKYGKPGLGWFRCIQDVLDTPNLA